MHMCEFMCVRVLSVYVCLSECERVCVCVRVYECMYERMFVCMSV